MRKSPGENAGALVTKDRNSGGCVQKPRRTDPPGLDGEVKVRFAPALFGHETTLGTESNGQDALVLGCVAASRTQALRLAERDRLPLECGLNAGVLHINCETEACHGIP